MTYELYTGLGLFLCFVSAVALTGWLCLTAPVRKPRKSWRVWFWLQLASVTSRLNSWAARKSLQSTVRHSARLRSN